MTKDEKRIYTKAQRLQRLISKQQVHGIRVWSRILKIEKGLPQQPRTAKLRKQFEIAYNRLAVLKSYQIPA